MRVIFIADDLTGAADSAAAFARRGFTTQVLWGLPEERSLPPSPRAEVVALSTDSRQVPVVEAVARVAAAAQVVQEWGGEALIYKKVDSTLRGHPGAELHALLDALGASRALVAPAFPAQGRVTREGRQWVRGVPLSQTVFGAEVPQDDVRELFAGAQGVTVRHLPLEAVRGSSVALTQPGCWIVDAESAADLERLARAALAAGVRVWCGSAGLSHALASALAEPGASCPDSASALACPKHVGRGILVVAASRHPQTLRQIVKARRCGVPLVAPPASWFTGGEAVDEVATTLAVHLAHTGRAMLTTARLPALPGQGQALVARLAETVLALACGVPPAGDAPAGLVLTGGDTARAVGRALHAHSLWLRGEVAPGIPWGRLVGGLTAGMPVVTKAGGFGDDRALLQALWTLEAIHLH